MASCTLLTTLLLVLAATHCATSAKNVVCYFGSWATYRGWPGTFNVADIDVSKCTHLVYAFAGLDASTVSVMSLDPYNDLEENWGKGSYKKFTALSQSNPDVKTLLAVGGWNEGSGKYSSMAATSAGRKRFAQSVVAFLKQYGFQGLDLDWEYPTQREGSRPADKANFVLLLQELSTQLKAENLLLTVAVGASMSIIDTAYDIPGISNIVDLVNLMSFDYYTSVSNVTGHASPLGSLSGDPSPYTVRWSVEKWLNGGCPNEKLVVGIPLYGRTYTLASESNHGLGAPAVGPGTSGPITSEAGSLAYFELCMVQEDEKWTVVNDQGTYTYKGNQWASYDSVDTINEKTKYIMDNNLGGVMVWSLESDDNVPVCAGEKNTLLAAINKGLGR